MVFLWQATRGKARMSYFDGKRIFTNIKKNVQFLYGRVKIHQRVDTPGKIKAKSISPIQILLFLIEITGKLCKNSVFSCFGQPPRNFNFVFGETLFIYL